MKSPTMFFPVPGLLVLWLATAAAVPAQTTVSTFSADAGMAASGDYLSRLIQHGFTEGQSQAVSDCLAEARSQNLPTAALTLRLEEGLAKNIDPVRLVASLQARLSTLVQARAMAQPAHYALEPGSPGDDLLVAVALALESGVAADNLAEVLRRGNGQATLRIASIVEAGESLQLAGIDSETTRNLMNDCMDRDLRRMEVLRAVRYAIQQHRDGVGGADIRRSLWSGQVAIEGAGGWHGGGANDRLNAGGDGPHGPGYGGGRAHRSSAQP